jgi:imidazolonepropionase
VSRSVLVRGARQLLTLHGPTGPRRGDALRDLGIIEDGSLLITNGIISSVGPTRRIENLAEARAAEEINAAGRVVMPGFCDPHVQLVGPPARAVNYPLGHAASKITVSELSNAALSHLRNTTPGRLEQQARRIVQRQVRHGTTSFEAKSGSGVEEAPELKALRVCSALGAAYADTAVTYVASAPSTQFEGRADAQLEWTCAELLPKIRQRNLATFAEVVCDPAGFSLEHARVFLAAAGRLGFLPKIQAEHATRMGAARLATDMDARSITGLNFCNELDAQILSRSRTVAVLLPGRAAQGWTKAPPARLLIDSGVAVALGSGYSPSLPATFSMQPVVSFACSALDMTTEEAISAATINAAHAMDRATVAGSLEFGKDADLLMLDLPDYREIPYHLGVNHVELVMRKGEVVYREGAVG